MQPSQSKDENYDAHDDVAKSFDEAYRVIRERMANGGPGWTPKDYPKPAGRWRGSGE